MFTNFVTFQGLGQQGDGVPAGDGRRGGGAGRAQAHCGHAHFIHVGVLVPQHRPPAAHGQRRRHLRAVGRGIRPAAAELPGARRRRDGARLGAQRHGRHVRVGRLRPRRARVGHALRPRRAGLRYAPVRREQRALSPVGRLAGVGLGRLVLPPVRPARRPRGGALRQGQPAVRRQLGRVVAERAPAVRGLQRLHGVRVGRAARGARVRAVRARAPRGARAARARRHGAVHRLVGHHAARVGLTAPRPPRASRPRAPAYLSFILASVE